MAGRMTSYSTSGLVETWKLGLTSQVNDDIRLRITLSFDIRAPNLGELFNDIPGLRRPGRLQDRHHRGFGPLRGRRQSEPAAGNRAHLFGRHRADPALGAGPDHVVRLVFDQREGHHLRAPAAANERRLLPGRHTDAHRRQLLQRLGL